MFGRTFNCPGVALIVVISEEILRSICCLRELIDCVQVSKIVTGGVRLAPLGRDYVCIVVGLLRFVGLLEEPAKLQRVGVVNFG